MDRTTCACENCVACCKRQPGPLIPGDLERIAKFLNVSVEQAKQYFKASKGSLIGLRDGRVMQVPSITPKQMKDIVKTNIEHGERCIFLDQENRCMIHPVSPFGCAYVDTHMSKEEADRRVKTAIIKQCTREYQELRETLKTGKEE